MPSTPSWPRWGKPSITDFDHDAIRLPNGDTAVLATTQKVIDVNGTPTTYVGDMVLVLDKNFQVIVGLERLQLA